VRLGAQQVITREVEASERNARLRICFDVAVEDLAPCLHLDEDRQSLRTLGMVLAIGTNR